MLFAFLLLDRIYGFMAFVYRFDASLMEPEDDGIPFSRYPAIPHLHRSEMPINLDVQRSSVQLLWRGSPAVDLNARSASADRSHWSLPLSG